MLIILSRATFMPARLAPSLNQPDDARAGNLSSKLKIVFSKASLALFSGFLLRCISPCNHYISAEAKNNYQLVVFKDTKD